MPDSYTMPQHRLDAMNRVLRAVGLERAHQEAAGETPDWVVAVERLRIESAPLTYLPDDRLTLLRIAAYAVAALERLDEEGNRG